MWAKCCYSGRNSCLGAGVVQLSRLVNLQSSLMVIPIHLIRNSTCAYFYQMVMYHLITMQANVLSEASASDRRTGRSLTPSMVQKHLLSSIALQRLQKLII